MARGYHDPRLPRVEQSIWRAPLFFSIACWLTLLASWHEVSVRQAFSYVPGSEPLRGWLSSWFAGALAALGVLGAWRVKRSIEVLFTASLLACSVLVGASASLAFFTFDSALGPFVRPLSRALSSVSLGICFGLSLKRLLPLWRQLDLLSRALDPWLVLATMVALVVAMSMAPALGLVRTASVAAMLIALWAYWHTALCRFLERRTLRYGRLLSASAAAWFVAHASWFALSLRWVSLEDVGYFHNTIVYSKKSERSELVVTSGSGGLQLFVDRSLKLSDHDHDRYYESLVQPALAAAKRPTRAAVLGVADGLAVRQLLKHPGVQSVDLVTVDGDMAKAARRMPWLSALNEGALASSKVNLIEAEPLPWLWHTPSKYDVVIVDLLDPTDYRQGKNYTTHFYRLVQEHLNPGGVVAIQAVSPFDAPKTFANVGATVRAAGLETSSYRAAIPSLGDWGFVLASREPLQPPPKVESEVEFLSDSALAAMFHLPDDERVGASPASKLYDQRAVHLLLEERRRRR